MGKKKDQESQIKGREGHPYGLGSQLKGLVGKLKDLAEGSGLRVWFLGVRRNIFRY